MIRLTAIELRNVKNVEYGRISSVSGRRQSRVIGIYGQNGSGKTAVVDALACLRDLLRGDSLDSRRADFIGSASDRAASAASDRARNAVSRRSSSADSTPHSRRI